MKKNQCPSCDRIYELQEKFCGVCGVRLHAVPDKPARRGSRGPAWIATLVLVLGALAAGGWWYLQRSSPKAETIVVSGGSSAAADVSASEAGSPPAEGQGVSERAPDRAPTRTLPQQQAPSSLEVTESQRQAAEQRRAEAERAAARERDRELAERERLVAERELAERERLLEQRQAEIAAAEQRQREQAEREAEAAATRDAALRRASPSTPTAPEPTYIEATLRPGTRLDVEITTTLSTRTHRVGDTFSSRLAKDIYTADGVLAISAGSEIRGQVTDVQPLRRVGGRASLSIAFTELIPPVGPAIGLKATLFEQGKDRRKDKKKILGAAIAGALLGKATGKGTGEILAGAAVGAAAGTAAVAASAKGKDAVIQAGSKVGLVLEEVVTVTAEVTGVVNR